MIIVGSLILTLAWILRIVFHDATLYYITVFLVGFFYLMVSLPLDRYTTAHGLEVGSLSVAIYRNASAMSLRVILYAILALMIEVFKVSFLIAATSVFMILAVTLLLKPKTQKLL